MRYTLIIYRDGSATDITDLCQEITWRGRKGSSARSLSVSIIDDDGYKHSRSGIDVEEGYSCIFMYDGAELFRGIIMRTNQSDNKIMGFVAYDNAIYLAKNKDTFCYTGKTADEIFMDVCNRFGLPVGSVSSCRYRIPELTKKRTTGWDAVADALSLEYDSTGIRHYVQSHEGKLSLITRRENILQWVIEAGTNLGSYTYVKSIEDIVTRQKMLSSDGTVLATAINEDLEKKVGIFQDIECPDEVLSSAQINELCRSVLSAKSNPDRTLDVKKTLGIPDVISGIGVFIIIPHLGLARTFYVDEDTHTFRGNLHTMTLKLNHASDITK